MITVAQAPHLRRAGLVVTTASLAAIAFATLLPEPPITVGSHFCLACGSFGGVDAILNVILFVPLGVGLALSGFPGKRSLLAMCALSALIETAQLLVIPGRYSTIGDVLTNTLGGALGFALGRYAKLWLRPPPRIARNLAVAWASIWLAIQIVSNFGFAPVLPDSRYYGQLAREFPNVAVFRGLVRNASIGGVPIPNTVLADSHGVRRLLLEGATVASTVVPAAPTHGIAPIMRVAGGRNEEIVLIAQKGNHLIFGVRTGAAVFRLRPPFFALPDAFPRGISAVATVDDTLRLSSRYLAGDVRMSAQSRSGTHDHRVPFSASLAWTFWLPFQWFIEGTSAEIVVSLIWIACLMIPFGYWSLQIRGSSRSHGIREQAVPVLLGAAVLYVGLVLIPCALGLSTAQLRDWLATLAGVFIGCGLSARMSKLIANRALANGAP